MENRLKLFYWYAGFGIQGIIFVYPSVLSSCFSGKWNKVKWPFYCSSVSFVSLPFLLYDVSQQCSLFEYVFWSTKI